MQNWQGTRTIGIVVMVSLCFVIIHQSISIVRKNVTVDSSTFGSELCAMRVTFEMVKALCYKLCIFGVPIDGPASIFCDNEAVYKNIFLLQFTITNKHHFIAYHIFREVKEFSETNIDDLFTMTLTQERRNFLLRCFTY